MHDTITQEEIDAVNEVLKSGEYTQGKVVEEFEGKFAEWNGFKHCVMVNSGSTANLLIVTLLKEKYKLKEGDEVLVPAVTWPTTVYPIIQNNLVPVFCDVDDSFNISLESMERVTSEKTKALFLVHLLGQAVNMDKIIKFCNEKNIVLIEDCCESLGAEYKGRKVGGFGVMSSFSLYFGHHMTTIEGGIIATNDEKTADLLKSIRSHGWIRNSLRAEEYKKEFNNLDFVFDLMGYNVRSTNLNAAIGLVQLKKLKESISIRKNNHEIFNELISKNYKLRTQKVDLETSSSFCLPIILPSTRERDLLLSELPKQGIECRTVISGNLLKQPIFEKKLIGKYKKDDCRNSDIIHSCGMYLPNHQFIDREKVEYMVEKINEILGGANG